MNDQIGHCSPEEFQWISQRIYENECGSDKNKLIWWNENENFMSVGLGHFIWYPRDTKKKFSESFPRLLDYMEKCGHDIPDWLNTMRLHGIPWSTREEFMSDSIELKKELQKFLLGTFNLQVGYILKRAKHTLEKISMILPAAEQSEIIDKFHAVAQGPKGFYPLVDYINFKGSGSKSAERYQNKGWGLIQVLEEMETPVDSSNAVEKFVKSATYVLERRIKNSPQERNEAKWLPGWKKRLATYLD